MTENTGELMQYTDLMQRNTDLLNWSQNSLLARPNINYNNIRFFKSIKFYTISLLPKYFIHTGIIFNYMLFICLYYNILCICNIGVSTEEAG